MLGNTKSVLCTPKVNYNRTDFEKAYVLEIKEFSLCHKSWFSDPYIVVTQCRDLRYFKLRILLDQIS